ncbi:hypothetical protein, partial [Bacillus cereus]|uniref:hypothetical protein n=1 Tax=Bacillus cereus TaxID=1396 RepID=UPI001C5512FE
FQTGSKSYPILFTGPFLVLMVILSGISFPHVGQIIFPDAFFGASLSALTRVPFLKLLLLYKLSVFLTFVLPSPVPYVVILNPHNKKANHVNPY